MRLQDVDITPYEGLVAKTSMIYEGPLGMEREDLQQILRLKIATVVASYDPARNTVGINSFVYGCMRNLVKDLVKAKVRREPCACGHGRQRHPNKGACESDGCACEVYRRVTTSYIEDLAPSPVNDRGERDRSLGRDRWEHEHMRHDDEHEDEVLLPASLTPDERLVVALLYVGFRQSEIAGELDVAPRDVERKVRSIRRKMADWRPSTSDAEVIQLQSELTEALRRYVRAA